MNMPCYATSVYARIALETMDPREASLLLKAAAKRRAVLDEWKLQPPQALSDALLFNRRLWIIFIDAVIRDDNKLSIPVRQNVLNLGIFVMSETFSLMTGPKQEHLENLIRINRGIAAGLGSKAGKSQAQRVA